MQIEIVLQPEGQLCIPFNYNYQLQSAVYAKLREAGVSDFWHDVGHGEKKSFKLFVTGPLKGSYAVKDRKLLFSDTVSFEVRSPVFDFCDSLHRALEQCPMIKLFNTVLRVTDIRLLNRHITSPRVICEAVSPVVVRTELRDGRTVYYTPQDEEFVEGIKRNLSNKYSLVYGGDADDISITPLGEHKKTVTRYKDTWITGYSGRYEINGDTRLIELLYNAGMGMKTAQGFGMIKIIE